jgi:hypothetical protein
LTCSLSLYRIIREIRYLSIVVSKSELKNEAEHPRPEISDPVLSMLGVGKDLWRREAGDSFIERLRSEDTLPPVGGRLDAPAQNVAESVWHRIQSHQGEEFKTATGKALKYEVEGAGIWFYRDGRRINRKLSRTQVEVAIARCPLTTTTEIKDLIDYPYLFALLTDPRIRGEAW